MKDLDLILDKLKDKDISQCEARKQLIGVFNSNNFFVCPITSKYSGTLIFTRRKRCLDVYWCIGKLIPKKSKLKFGIN